MRFLLCALLFPFASWPFASWAEEETARIVENAGSAFTENAFSQMGEVEYTHYRRLFDYAMDYAEPEKPFAWETKDPLDPTLAAKGQIAASQAFTSDSGATCRNFSETYNVRDKSQQLQGVACKRSEAEAKEKLTSWCKLRITEVPDCALEPKQGLEALLDSGEKNYYKYKSGFDLFQNNLNQSWQRIWR